MVDHANNLIYDKKRSTKDRTAMKRIHIAEAIRRRPEISFCEIFLLFFYFLILTLAACPFPFNNL